MTNYEKIKAMTVEEMANILGFGENGCCVNADCFNWEQNCIECAKTWLESEAEEDG